MSKKNVKNDTTNTDTTVDATADTAAPTAQAAGSDAAPQATGKQRGQTKKTEAELRTAFEASGVQGLLEVEVSDKGNTRCTVRLIEGNKLSTVYGPVAGNTFIRAIEGAVAMGSLIASK